MQGRGPRDGLRTDGGTTTPGPYQPPEFDILWHYTVHLEDDTYRFDLQTRFTASIDPTIDTLVADLAVPTDLPDPRASHHWKWTPLQRWVRAHILREARGLDIAGLANYLEDHPFVAADLGFITDEYEGFQEDTPGYTNLRDMWEDTFTPRLRGACQVLAERLVHLARDRGLPAPDDVFRPEDIEVEEPTEDDPTVRELTTTKTGEIWQHARPMVLEHWYLQRHHNWQVPEATFFDGHAHLATASDDVFPESGLGNMVAKSDHDRVHFPSTHREQLKRFSIGEIRDLHRSVTEDLIAEARREGELIGELEVAVDITKGHPWTGEVRRNEDGENIEPYVLGYKNDNDQRTQYYFQWASVQIVGLDIPLVLDAVPVHRGYSRGDIVDDLLGTATEMVDDIRRVYMDAEYDSAAVKNTAEKHGVTYCTRRSRDAADKKRMRQMWENDEAVRIVEEEDRPGMPVRKRIYVPHIAVGDDDDEDGDEEEETTYRQELIDDFEPLDGDKLPDESPFESMLSDMREEEEEEEDDFDASELYVVFETNDALANKRGGAGNDPIPKSEQRQAAARMVRKYGRRWGIENGYKKLGHFLPRSGSKDPVLRFFGFAFAATLYNCWRLVDLLVKLSVEDDPEYTPLVTASRFLAVAEGQFGLKPPPD